MDQKINRAEILWENWKRHENQIQNLAGAVSDKNSLKYKLQFLSEGVARISTDPDESEKLFMRAIRTVMNKVKMQLYPDLLARKFYDIRRFLLIKPSHVHKFRENKARNISELTDLLRSAGLNHFTGGLLRNLDYERQFIQLTSLTGLQNNLRMEVSVNLEKISLGRYGFKSYDITFSGAGGEEIRHNFSAHSGVTLAEAYNLLQNRPVLKRSVSENGGVNETWLRLSEKSELLTYPANYDFDLKKILLETGIRLDYYAVSKDMVRKGLEAGNAVEFEFKGEKFILTADISDKKVTFRDAALNPLSIEALREKLHPPPVQSHGTQQRFNLSNELQRDNNMIILR